MKYPLKNDLNHFTSFSMQKGDILVTTLDEYVEETQRIAQAQLQADVILVSFRDIQEIKRGDSNTPIAFAVSPIVYNELQSKISNAPQDSHEFNFSVACITGIPVYLDTSLTIQQTRLLYTPEEVSAFLQTLPKNDATE